MLPKADRAGKAGRAPPVGAPGIRRPLDLALHIDRLASLLAAEREEERARFEEARGRLSLAERASGRRSAGKRDRSWRNPLVKSGLNSSRLDGVGCLTRFVAT